MYSLAEIILYKNNIQKPLNIYTKEDFKRRLRQTRIRKRHVEHRILQYVSYMFDIDHGRVVEDKQFAEEKKPKQRTSTRYKD
jgi:hypothetical protein